MKQKQPKTTSESLPAIQRENTFIIEEGNVDLFEMLIQELSSPETKHLSFDVETDGKHFIIAKLDGISFYFKNDRGYYVNLYKTSEKWQKTCLDKLKPFFENEKIGKIGQNIIYDIHIMMNYNIEVKGPIYDTLIACYLLNPDDRPFKLKKLVPKHLKIEMREYKQIDRENITDMAIYGMEDSRCTYLLYQFTKEKLLAANLWRLFNDIEMPFLRVLFNMERRGIKVDVERLSNLRNKFEKKVEELRNTFCIKMFGLPHEGVEITVSKTIKKEKQRVKVPFNIESNDHLAELFYNLKGFRINGKIPLTKTKKYSADKHTINKLVEQGYDDVYLLLEYRMLNTLLKNFIRPILDEHTIGGRVYPTFLQHGTRTGRLSSSHPNFQNIPVRFEDGKEIRKCFVADEGYKIIDADLSQIELRIMAHYSKDPNLVKAYLENIDLHDLAGQEVFGTQPGATSLPENKDVRTLCKNLNFGLSYGAGAKKFALMANIELAKQDKEEKEQGTFTISHKITEEQSQQYIDKYFKKFYGIRSLQVSYPNEVRRTGYATTILGRRRFLPNIYKKPFTGNRMIDKENWKKTAAAERQAVSTLIQGTASDVIKLAMIKADHQGVLLFAQIHDELLAVVKQEREQEFVEILKDCMEHCGLTFSVPIVAKIITSDRWEQPSEDIVIHDEDEETEE